MRQSRCWLVAYGRLELAFRTHTNGIEANAHGMGNLGSILGGYVARVVGAIGQKDDDLRLVTRPSPMAVEPPSMRSNVTELIIFDTTAWSLVIGHIV